MGTVLQVRVERLDLDPVLTVLCAGFEDTAWRANDLVRDLFDRHLASFALSFSEFTDISGETAAKALRRAAQIVYATDKYSKRGEFGELLLHGALVDFFGAAPAVSKLFYKDSDNDTVKGFDSVHLVMHEEGVELWLGEAKFYKDVTSAVREAVGSIAEHLRADFLKREFVLITNKLDPNWPHSATVRRLVDDAKSLDEISTSLVLPVLLTYESKAIENAEESNEAYFAALEAEALSAWESMSTKATDAGIRIKLKLILVPLEKKDRFVGLMHEKLRVWQHI